MGLCVFMGERTCFQTRNSLDLVSYYELFLLLLSSFSLPLDFLFYFYKYVHCFSRYNHYIGGNGECAVWWCCCGDPCRAGFWYKGNVKIWGMILKMNVLVGDWEIAFVCFLEVVMWKCMLWLRILFWVY